MGSLLTVTLRKPIEGEGKREYVHKHEQEVKQADVGAAIIKFEAQDYNFVVVIPRANSLFTNPEENTLHFTVSPGTPEYTPTINTGVTNGNKYEYHVFCEGDRDWAHKPGSSPPKIIIDF